MKSLPLALQPQKNQTHRQCRVEKRHHIQKKTRTHEEPNEAADFVEDDWVATSYKCRYLGHISWSLTNRKKGLKLSSWRKQKQKER